MKRFVRYVSIFTIFILCIACLPLAAQISVDPSDEFYTYAKKWEIEGYVDHLPMLRPYPVAVIKDILQQVMQKGDRQEVAVASDYYTKFMSGKLHVSAEGGGAVKLSGTTDSMSTDKQVNGELAVSGDTQFLPLVSLGYDLGIYGNNTSTSNSDVIPEYTNDSHDIVDDPSTVGPFSLNIDMNSIVAVGTKDIYATAGLNRTGYGPFLGQGVAINDTSFHSANMVFAYQGKKWAYTQMIASIGAAKNNGTSFGDNYKGEKYLVFHAIRLNLLPKLDFTYYESCVYGRKFDSAYFVPAPYMAIQGINGASDNVQMGVTLEYQLARSLKWATDIMIDDLGLNQLLKLNINSKNRVAAQTGLIFAPQETAWNLLTMNYTIVTPYTYAHWDYDDNTDTFTSDTYNYQNYTNHGVCIGSSLDPDSDAISFTAKFKPTKMVDLTLLSTFVRHGNIYESLSSSERNAIWKQNYENGTVYSTDGSVNTQQMLLGNDSSASYMDTAWNYLNFLTQEHIMYTCQMGAKAELQLPPMKYCTVTLKAGYIFEYIHNKGVDNSLYTGSSKYRVYESGGVTVDPEASAEKEYEAWVANLHDDFNQYITASVKISF